MIKDEEIKPVHPIFGEIPEDEVFKAPKIDWETEMVVDYIAAIYGKKKNQSQDLGD